LAVMAILVGVAFLLATPYADILTGTVRLQNGDIPVLILAAQGAVALSLIASRNLPGIAGLLEGRRRGQVVLPGRGSVFLPVFAAFSLLFLIFLLFILFGVGFIDFVSQVSSSPPLIGVMAFLFLAFLVSVAATFGLARSEANTELYIKPRDPAKTRQHWILGVSLAVAFLLFVPAYLLFDGYSFPRAGLESQHWIHFLCIGLLVAVGPYGFYMAREHRRIRLMEERFPDFLRDIASSHKGGLTLTQATVIASRGEYGPLSPEVQKMADQLKWNVSFNEALQRFSDRVRTPLVQRAVDLILQANRSGGATTDVLLAAARDARELKSLENDRRLSMSLYTVVIYVTFFVFLGVVAVMYSQFIPQLVASSEAAAESARELGGVSVGGIGGEVLRIEDFQLFYFLAAITQGLGDGIVAGLMGQGKAVLGLRHSFLMVLLSYLTFGFLL
jgi:archaeal flagellar protein FlaJ